MISEMDVSNHAGNSLSETEEFINSEYPNRSTLPTKYFVSNLIYICNWSSTKNCHSVEGLAEKHRLKKVLKPKRLLKSRSCDGNVLLVTALLVALMGLPLM